MTKTEARRKLDAARDGANISQREIVEALRLTGDLSDDQADAAQNEPVQIRRTAGTWERKEAHRMARATPFDGLGAAA